MSSVSMQSLGISRAERLSAFIDGESTEDRGGLADEGLAQFLSEFGNEDRALWADYHLVGDMLKSEDLAVDPAAEQAFLGRFSAAFESEPALLAPRAFKPNRSALRARRFMPTLAAAAAVVTLTWILVPRQMHGDTPAGAAAVQTVAANLQGSTPVTIPALPSLAGTDVQRVAMAASSSDMEAAAAPAHDETNMIRDAQLDQYLDAHQQFAQRPVPQSVPLVRVVSASQEQ